MGDDDGCPLRLVPRAHARPVRSDGVLSHHRSFGGLGSEHQDQHRPRFGDPDSGLGQGGWHHSHGYRSARPGGYLSSRYAAPATTTPVTTTPAGGAQPGTVAPTTTPTTTVPTTTAPASTTPLAAGATTTTTRSTAVGVVHKPSHSTHLSTWALALGGARCLAGARLHRVGRGPLAGLGTSLDRLPDALLARGFLPRLGHLG